MKPKNLEVFYRTRTALRNDDWRDDDGNLAREGWFYWFCTATDHSAAIGPFKTKEEALSDAGHDLRS